MKRTVVLLLLSFLCVYSTRLAHKFSSTVHPCDDFEEFVCNEDENGGLSPLFDSLRNGFYDRLKEALLKDNDVVIEGLKNLFAGPNITFQVDFPYHSHVPTRYLNLTYHNGLTNNTHRIDTTQIQVYLNLLFSKYTHQNKLRNANWTNEVYNLYDDVKAQVIGIVQNSTLEQEHINKFVSSFKQQGVDGGLENEESYFYVLMSALSTIQQRFIDLKNTLTLEADCNDDCKIKRYSNLVETAMNETVYSDRTLERLPFVLSIPQELRDILNRMFIRTKYLEQDLVLVPVAFFYVPWTEDSIEYMMKYNELIYQFSLEAFTDVVSDDDRFLQMAKGDGFKCYHRAGYCRAHIEFLEAVRLTTKIIKERTEDGGSGFSDLHWFFFYMQSRWCIHGMTEEEYACDSTFKPFLKQSTDFQKAFNCKPGHKLYTAAENMCKIFV